MSRYFGTYGQYLGAQRCCDSRGPGPQGIQGPTGDSMIGPRGNTGPTGPTGSGETGPAGPTQINTNFISLNPFISSSITIPSQTSVISNYSVSLSSPGDSIDNINMYSFPPGYQANIYVNGTAGTIEHPCIISSSITSGLVRTNLNSNMQLIGESSSNYQYAIITITTDGSIYYCNISGYY
jgi:hypothetical protein